MEASCTMVMVIGKGNWERMVLPSTPLLEETTYQQTQTKTILNPSFISFLAMKLIVTIKEFKTVMVQNLGVCCFVGDLKTTRLAASKYILSIILSLVLTDQQQLEAVVTLLLHSVAVAGGQKKLEQAQVS